MSLVTVGRDERGVPQTSAGIQRREAIFVIVEGGDGGDDEGEEARQDDGGPARPRPV